MKNKSITSKTNALAPAKNQTDLTEIQQDAESSETDTAQKPTRMGGRMGGPSAPPEKAKNIRGTWVKLLVYSKKYAPLIIISLLLAVVGSVFAILGPDKIKDLTGVIFAGVPEPDKSGVLQYLGPIDIDKVVYYGKILIFIYSASFFSRVVGNIMMSIATQKVAGKIRSDISAKINRLPLKYFDKSSFGDVLSRVTNDADTIGQYMNQSIDVLVMSISMFVGSTAMMFITNWIMAITAISSSLIGVGLITFIMLKSQKEFVSQARGLGEINGHIEEVYSGHNVVKAYNGTKAAKAEFERINKDLEHSGRRSQFFSGLMPAFMGFIGNLSYLSVCVVGAVLTARGKIGIETILAFFIYIRIFTNPLTQMAQAFQNLQRTAAAGERVFEFLAEPELSPECQNPISLLGIKGDVEFLNVNFGYTPEKTVIHDFSASVKAGQKVAIVGPTGAGKTTMVNLLMRFYEPNSGEIFIDGTPISKVTRENLHNQFCMVLQDTWLFEGTLKENIVYSKQGVTDEQVIDACKAVGLHYFVSTLPLGYDTVLDDKTSLSQGQKQLVTIARAVIQNAPMLILDEATSSVDTRTEVLIQEAMDRLMEGRTSFVIAHRLSTIKNADMILVMKDGDIIERGSHSQLLEGGGFYCELYNSQFEQA